MNIPEDFIKNGYPLPLHKLQAKPEEEEEDKTKKIIINGKIIPKTIIYFQSKHISKIISLKFIYESL
jgi:hypothetical protein